MASYIEKFSSTVRKKQTEQILKLLNKQRSTGQIRTVEEFTSKLERLVRELTQTNITPTLKLFPAQLGDVTSSEAHNYMLERLEDDLTTGFAEAYNIDQVQKAHQAIVRDVILKNLKHGIAELESKVNLYEFLQADTTGFTSSLFSTFRESREERTARSVGNQQVAALFVDPRNNLNISEDASVDLIGERLTLGFETKNVFDARRITQIFDSDTITSSEAVTRPGTTLNNIIDNSPQKYWIQSVLVKDEYTSLTTKLEFSLPGTKTINFVELVPANVYPFRLKKIYYYDANNVVTLLSEPDLLVDSSISYIFPTTTTSKVILEFESTSQRKVNFEIEDGNQLTWQAIDRPNYSLAGAAHGLKRLQLPATVTRVLGAPALQKRSFQGNAFEIGFDSIRFGVGSYAANSIYVSKPLATTDPLQVGLKIIEKRPSATNLTDVPAMTETTYDTDDDIFFHASIEYWVVKHDFDSAGNIVASYKLPILPTGVERVHHERLILTERSSSDIFLPDTGYLQFFADADVSNITVYKNGTALADGEWTDVSDDPDRVPNSNVRMRFKLKVTSVLVGDIFTVSYTPVVSTTVAIPEELSEYSPDGISVVDVVGNLSGRVVAEQLLLLNKGPNPDTVTKSNIYLVIILRNNTSDTSLTPAVEEYTLVVGEKDGQKFSPDTF